MAAMDAEELNRRFGVPGLARVVLGSGGLTKVVVSTAAAFGEMYLHGAHVTSWKPAGAAEVLFVSPHSLWQDDKAIRGGVPICFPWFGDKAGDPHAPAHGFVRTRLWELQAVEQAGDGVSVSMVTESDADTKNWWPADFRLLYRATFGAELKLELIVMNKGAQPLQFEEALHAYFHVGDATQARISGLDDTTFQDKTDSFREKPQSGDVVISRETDRVYLDTAHPIELHDPVLKRELRVTKENSLTTVIWNPWIDKARALSDLGEDQWKQMLCIETSNVGAFAVKLKPGEQHIMSARVGLS